MIEEDDHPAHPDERWLVSYADFITLLFALFVLLYALSNSSKAKAAAGMNSVAKAVGMRPSYGSGGVRPGLAQSPGGVVGATQLAAAKAQVAAAVAAISQLRPLDDYRFARAGDLAFGREVLCQRRRPDHPVAAAGARRAGQNDGVASQHFQIDGFTDSVPIVNARFHDNWDLSAARASSVLRYTLSHTSISPDQLGDRGLWSLSPGRRQRDRRRPRAQSQGRSHRQTRGAGGAMTSKVVAPSRADSAQVRAMASDYPAAAAPGLRAHPQPHRRSMVAFDARLSARRQTL